MLLIFFYSDGRQGRPYNFGPIPTVCTTLVEDEDPEISPSTPTLTESDTTISMRSPDAMVTNEAPNEEPPTPVHECQPLLNNTEAGRDGNANVMISSNVCNDDVDELLITSVPVDNRNNNRRTKQTRVNIICDIIEYI